MAASYFVVYDLLPLQRPEFFPGVSDNFQNWLHGVVAYADGVVCISKATADALISYLEAARIKRFRSMSLKIGWFHLGADFRELSSSSENALSEAITKSISARTTFLMVSTIEPRKGYVQALRAFELLWSRGVEVNLAIVGKMGWSLEAFCEELTNHNENGKRLFWFEKAQDKVLDDLYSKCSCVLAASEGEGFGLSLIEAAMYEKPLLCRDLPVFREVAGDHANYFSGLTAEDLAIAIENWLVLQSENRNATTVGMPHLSWAESCLQLRSIVMANEWYKEWPLSSI
jgi:glycosyltransferase involved in cell wall biosynthesis